jgi:hypothetical protein
MSAKDTWVWPIRRQCMDWNGLQVCEFSFSISYGNKEYQVNKEDTLDISNGEYLEITESIGHKTKRITWGSITSIDRT